MAILKWHERNSTIKQNSQIHLLIKLQNQLKWETWKNEGQEEKTMITTYRLAVNIIKGSHVVLI